jgi:FtsH-binding integral membrane protein
MFGTNYTDEIAYRSASEINSAMVRVYNHMMLAIANSMVVSYLISQSPSLMAAIFGTPLKWLVMFAPLIMIFAYTFVADKFTKTGAVAFLHAFAALMGVSMSAIFVLYTGGSIFMAFVSSVILFATMSFYGYFTKRSLESLGQFMMIGLIAICIASIVNIFVGSSVMTMVISAIAIIIFLGLTAYDTQQIREMISYDNSSVSEVTGALTLYLDFINIFLNLLQLFGDRKE